MRLLDEFAQGGGAESKSWTAAEDVRDALKKTLDWAIKYHNDGRFYTSSRDIEFAANTIVRQPEQALSHRLEYEAYVNGGILPKLMTIDLSPTGEGCATFKDKPFEDAPATIVPFEYRAGSAAEAVDTILKALEDQPGPFGTMIYELRASHGPQHGKVASAPRIEP